MKAKKLLHKIPIVIFCGLTVFYTAVAVLTSAALMMFGAFISAFWSAALILLHRRAEKRGISPAGYNIAAVFLACPGLVFTTIPSGISSGSLWRYPFQRWYIGMFRNIREPEGFPDFTADVQGGYRFEYLPTIMQGTGHYSVTFRTTPERAAEYAAMYAPQAVYTLNLSENEEPVSDGYFRWTDKEFKPANAGQDGSLDVYLSSAVKNADPETTAVYVLETNHNRNHPHSLAVITDTGTGLIQLSKLG